MRTAPVPMCIPTEAVCLSSNPMLMGVLFICMGKVAFGRYFIIRNERR